ncbi:MAG: TlyA family RNA methyltransferase [Deltaproteobacteria bacterium]|nr:TlyA family RNA methyltransferase [Deltaproteobacteria bacterium]
MRLDQLLVQRGLYPSREQAQKAVRAGGVKLADHRILKPALAVDENASVEILGEPEPFVSRAGRKLDGALHHFGLRPQGWVCLDVGASTGGFTDCLLKKGAAKVFAVDVGRDQMVEAVRRDPRVHCFEGVNARYFPSDLLSEPCGLVVVDVSFISLLKVAPALLPQIASGGLFLPLIKPQFEVGRSGIGKGGIVRDAAIRSEVIERRIDQLASLGLEPMGRCESSLPGSGGNREAFALFRRPQAC